MNVTNHTATSPTLETLVARATRSLDNFVTIANEARNGHRVVQAASIARDVAVSALAELMATVMNDVDRDAPASTPSIVKSVAARVPLFAAGLLDMATIEIMAETLRALHNSFTPAGRARSATRRERLRNQSKFTR